ncbi:MAG: Asp-tRNA(Asn)/Glu-tRNA(Gln) amidotransferase subunit GatC [Planctomycetota bacterium]|jgi:aspartyl-tRNA(Asn)/glutamyl-tRNA(Gln) amidotransferase subunit C
MPIDADEVRRLAKLARLELDEAEVGRLQKDLQRIVELVDAIREVPLAPDADSLTYFDSDVHREDRSGECLPQEDALFNAPETDGQFFLVPRILDPEEEGR